MLQSYLIVGLPFRFPSLFLRGSNGKKNERSPGKSVARTIRRVSNRYRIRMPTFLARPSERAFFSPD
ncbi:TPA: hypothetical protein GHD18_19615 [Escherichia coli]|nr:hypothetical protein CSC89_04020 [Klebsiella pneumoniae]HAH2408162.1 hypothetical protein [Escherichia coli]HAH2418410.1 hypothetical protein [Escherichia coli]HAH2422838.1 hypothetical protein [Escherichia coli]HAH2427581.1 hypothetical protein [Escherichia coli]